jgi:hypothetical protein
MKKLGLILGFGLISVMFNLQAQDVHRNQYGHGHDYHGNGNGHGGGGIGVPLDGGLLLILGGAGVAYIVSRKSRSKS